MSDVKEAPKAETTRGHKEQTREIERRAPLWPSPWAGSPFTAMRRFAEEMDRLFEGYDPGFGLHWPSFTGPGRAPRRREKERAQAAWSPRVDVLEREGQLVVRADLPGLTKDDVKVEVTGDTLTIHGERQEKKEEKREGYYCSECSYGSFYRALPLPEGIDPAKATALMRDGVLEVSMPAPPRPKETRGRPIEVQEAPKGA